MIICVAVDSATSFYEITGVWVSNIHRLRTGHSERRSLYGETDEDVAEKVATWPRLHC